MSSPPPGAEQIDIAPLYETVQVPSRFLPGVSAMVSTVACPSCGAKHAFTCKPFQCRCGLSMQHDIGVVHIWKKEPAGA